MMNYEQRSNCFLESHLPFPSQFFPLRTSNFERRSKARAAEQLPARVWGVDAEDEAFSLDCEVQNISSEGVYLLLNREIKFSSKISLVVHLLQGRAGGITAGIKGKVVRIDDYLNGRRGIAVATSECGFW
jgi:hypothetical protein